MNEAGDEMGTGKNSKNQERTLLAPETQLFFFSIENQSSGGGLENEKFSLGNILATFNNAEPPLLFLFGRNCADGFRKIDKGAKPSLLQSEERDIYFHGVKMFKINGYKLLDSSQASDKWPREPFLE